jgi:hypothetical protein
MPCCNCCEKTLNLGCLNACNAVYNTGIVVSNDGTWVLELTFGSVNIYYSANVLTNETVIFTLTNLNENYTYSGHIIDPSGEIVTLEVNGIEYDCIEFSTKIIINQ